jgi:pimeloyl-ACP methyl ester carboxylesterase
MERCRHDVDCCCLVLHPAGGGCDQGLYLGELLLPSSYDIIAISRSGYLNSSINKEYNTSQALREEAETIMELLDEKLGSNLKTKVSIMGLSAGGILALELARRYPTRFQNVILLSPLVSYKATEEVIPDPPEWVLKLAFGNDFIKWIAVRIFADATFKSLFGSTNDVSLKPQLRKVMECLLPAKERYAGFLFDFQCMQSYRLDPTELMSITCPILFVAAENDTQSKLESNRLPTQLLQKQPKTQEVIVQNPNACHMLLNDIAGMKETITTFLGGRSM